MSIVSHKAPDVGSPRGRSDLRAAAGLMPRPLVSHAGGGADASAEQLRVARVDSAVVGACRITPEVMRLGESRLKLGVIRNLAVHPQFDPLTIRAALLADARRFLEDHRYHVALTTGSEFELRRIGFTAVHQTFGCRLLPHAEAPVEWRSLRLRTAKRGDLPAMTRLYNAAFEDIPGSVLRSRAHMSRIGSEYDSTCVVTDQEGKVLAYFVPGISEEKLYVFEFAFSDRVTPIEFQEILRAFADVAECAAVIVAGAKSSLTRLNQNLRYVPAKSLPTGYVACLDIDELFQSMVPEWESLLAQQCTSQDRELTLLVASKPYRIRSHRGALIIDNEVGANKIALTSTDLTITVLGTMQPEDLLALESRLLNPGAADFFKALFPLREPGISPIDLL